MLYSVWASIICKYRLNTRIYESNRKYYIIITDEILFSIIFLSNATVAVIVGKKWITAIRLECMLMFPL